MSLLMWTYDLAREQAPTLDHLYTIAHQTQEAGYDALGLYLEHRFAYPSMPWAQGKGAVTPEMIRALRSEFPSLRIIPFINLLGHFEGFLYTEHGKRYREELFTGMQANPAMPEFVDLCHRIIDDTVAIFDDEIIHIGGDETQQLGASAASQARMAALGESEDPKALLYGHHFGPLAEYVQSKGRRPAVWGDMYLEHPTALDFMPRETLIFDWQYFAGLQESAKVFTERGFEVMGCPAVHTYNATWCHLEQTEQNVREVRRDVRAMGLAGVCVTTWECALMGAYDTLWPALRGCARLARGEEATLLGEYEAESRDHGDWARMMSLDLAALGGTFTPGRIRSSLKVRLLLQANPFLAWLHHAEEMTADERGQRAVRLADQALQAAPSEAYKGPAVFMRGAVEFIAIAEAARVEYAAGRASAANAKLALCRQLFDDLARIARRTHERIGGSLADIERCRIAKEHVERVMLRIARYGDGSLGYLPAFEVITHPKFVPHDQAQWWLINKWANQ